MRILLTLIFLSIFVKIYPQTVKVSAVGDIMAHDNLQYYALATDNGYESLFESTKDIFMSDDITIANLETPISDEIGVKNFPYFNAKVSLVEAIKKSGIDLLSLANNHSLDQRENGIVSTLRAVNDNNLLYAGSGLTPKEARSPYIFNRNGIIFGFLSATFSLNGIPLTEKEDKPFVYLVPTDNRESFSDFCKNIQETKKVVDFLIVAYHCGDEYTNTPPKYQSDALEKIAESGADVVLGHHPHVLQKIEYHTTSDLRKVLIAYSLGNFISGQANNLTNLKSGDKALYEDNFTKTAESIILQFDINRWDNNFFVSNVKIIPLYNLRYREKIGNINYSGFKTELIENIVEKESCKDFFNNYDAVKDLVKYRLDKMKKLIELPFSY